jgi:hypothetical protein
MVAPLAKTDPGVADLIREIDEYLRREKLEKLWRKYGSHALALAVLVVLGVAANVGWQRYTAGQRAERAREYEAALQQVAAEDPKATEALAAVAAQGNDGYAVFARLQAAAVKADTGDVEGATAIYEQLTNDSSVDEPIRNLALVLLALHTADTADPASLTQRLQPLTSDSNPWRYSALEITAVLARRAGDTERAQQILTQLADDLNAPQALRQRATEMLAALKG